MGDDQKSVTSFTSLVSSRRGAESNQTPVSARRLPFEVLYERRQGDAQRRADLLQLDEIKTALT